MNETSGSIAYRPGQYRKNRLTVAEWGNLHVRKWVDKQRDVMAEKAVAGGPVICFSRKIGAGALEIADILAEMIHFRVIDREVLEHMASEANLAEKTVGVYDERYPGRMSEFMNMLLAEKSFIKSDYARQLARSVIALADLEPTVFVGRGVHLILPRERVLAVRFICSQEFRVQRLGRELGIGQEQAEARLKQIDKEQRDFFKTVYQKKDANPYEFDLIINRDFISDAAAAAEIVACAYARKFKAA